MWAVLALGAILFTRPQAGDAPAPEVVAGALDGLEQALSSTDAKRIQSALEATQSIPHAGLVKRVGRVLDDPRQEVRLYAVQALRWQTHPDAREALERALKQRRWIKDPQMTAALLRGVGQHADPRSIPVLLQEPFEPNDRFCVQARLFGLARLRTPEALEGAFKILGATLSGGERRIRLWMDDARVALILLTGVDRGNSPELWEDWWRKSRKGFELAPNPPTLPKELRESWERYWGLPESSEREQRREDRGSQPARDKRE